MTVVGIDFRNGLGIEDILTQKSKNTFILKGFELIVKLTEDFTVSSKILSNYMSASEYRNAEGPLEARSDPTDLIWYDKHFCSLKTILCVRRQSRKDICFQKVFDFNWWGVEIADISDSLSNEKHYILQLPEMVGCPSNHNTIICSNSYP